MQERHVTLRGRTYFIDPPFFVMATQNPYEHEGVFPITESQLDRFLVKVDLEYGDEDTELSTLDLPHRGVIPDMLGDISPLLGERAFLVAQEVVDEVHVPEEVARMCVRIVRATRTDGGHRARREPTRVTASADGSEGTRRSAGTEDRRSRRRDLARALRAQPPRERRRRDPAATLSSSSTDRSREVEERSPPQRRIRTRRTGGTLLEIRRY